MDLGIGVLLLAGLGVFLGAAVQGSIGLGLGLVGAPVLALLDPSLVPGTLLLVTSVLPVLTSARELVNVDWRGLGFALSGRLPGVLIGSWWSSRRDHGRSPSWWPSSCWVWSLSR